MRSRPWRTPCGPLARQLGRRLSLAHHPMGQTQGLAGEDRQSAAGTRGTVAPQVARALAIRPPAYGVSAGFPWTQSTRAGAYPASGSGALARSAKEGAEPKKPICALMPSHSKSRLRWIGVGGSGGSVSRWARGRGRVPICPAAHSDSCNQARRRCGGSGGGCPIPATGYRARGHGLDKPRSEACVDASWVQGLARPAVAPVMTGSSAPLPRAATKRFRSNGSFRLSMNRRLARAWRRAHPWPCLCRALSWEA